MRLSSIINFSIDSLIRKRYKSLIITLLFAFSFVLVSVCIIPSYLTDYVYNSVNDSLSGGTKRTALVNVKEHKAGSEDFIDCLSRVDGIKASGAIGEYDMDVGRVKELYNIQKTRPSEEGTDSGYSDISGFRHLRFGHDAWELFDFKLIKGEHPADCEKITDSVGYLYLGYAYKDIPIGTEYKITDKYSFRVMGIFEQGETCITDNIEESGYYSSKTRNMDYMGVVVDTSVYQSENFFVIEEDADMGAVIKGVYELADRYDVGINVSSVEGIFEEERRTYKNITALLIELMIIVMIVAATMQTCIQVADVIEHFDSYGVMYANGATKRDITLIIVVENMFRYVIANMMAYGVSRLLLSIIFSEASVIKLVTGIYHANALIPVIIIGLIVSILSVLAPIILIRKKTPVELINNV